MGYRLRFSPRSLNFYPLVPIYHLFRHPPTAFRGRTGHCPVVDARITTEGLAPDTSHRQETVFLVPLTPGTRHLTPDSRFSSLITALTTSDLLVSPKSFQEIAEPTEQGCAPVRASGN